VNIGCGANDKNDTGYWFLDARYFKGYLDARYFKGYQYMKPQKKSMFFLRAPSPAPLERK